jgi:tetrahydromethanopterin S-methyltransferase subunit G
MRPEDRQDDIDALESRISELEERLDFTERLLANRRDGAA